MTNDESIELLKRFQEGDQTAANELFDRYVHRLIALAGSRLSETMRRRVAAEDVVQSAYRSFFMGAQEGKFEVSASGQLWGLLAAITLNKVRDKAKFHTAQKRNMNAEKSTTTSQSCFGLAPASFADEPTIDEALALQEVLKNTLDDLSDQQREILELYLQNLTNEEIAEQIRRSTRTVRRTLDEIKSKLASELSL